MNPGTRLEHYEIVDKLGEGGMGAVYRAQDTRLRRQVAIKVLPPMLAADEQQLRRLEREAQLLAALNHPNVAAIYGLGHDEVAGEQGPQRVTFLVMELVEGETLAERIAMGPLPWREAIDLGVGIAAGLEAAHERGIVHRDLKPANVQVCPDGSVKVLDFGLAKAFEGDGAASGSLDLSASPTLAAATRTGVILGTAAYMSPEQARGKPVDKRADVWAFGCVLYEMLVGRKVFGGETVSDILASILKESPALDQLPPSTPLRLRLLLERCLQKNPAQRMRDVGDVRLELQATRDEPSPAIAATPATARPAWGMIAAVAAATLAIGVFAGGLLSGSAPEPPELHVILEPEATATGPSGVAVSPDGLTVAEVRGNEAIQIRAADGLNWRDLPETDGARSVLFSANGERVHFTRRNELLSVGVDGSLPITEAALPEGSSLGSPFWDADGNLTIAVAAAGKLSLMRTSPQRGLEEVWTSDDANMRPVAHLAGPRYLAWALVGSEIALVDIEAGEVTPLLDDHADPQHLGGGVVTAVDTRGRLVVMQLDPATGAVVAAPSVRLEGAAMRFGLIPAYSVSASGTLVYLKGAAASGAGEALGWLGRDGSVTLFSERRDLYNNDSRLSPDDRFVALEVGTDTVLVWIHDIERDVRAPLVPGVAASFPVWSPDGREIILRIEQASADQPIGIYRVPVDRSAPPTLLLQDPEGRYRLPMDWSADGKLLAYVESDSETRASGNDIWLLPLDGGEPQPFLVTAADEADPRFSPDGRRIAFTSNQSGRREVYLRNVAGGGEVAVSGDGGVSPEWSAEGELFFTRGRDMFSVNIGSGDLPTVSAATLVVQFPTGVGSGGWDVSADGQRFYVNPVDDVTETASSLNAIFNWRGGSPGSR